MKKRILSLVLALVLLVGVLPLPVRAEAPRIPIYMGNGPVDYLAEEILKEIPTEGLSSRAQIQAVYDWIIAHCRRTGEADTNYFDPAAVEQAGAAFLRQVQDAVSRNQIALREELRTRSGLPLPSTDYIDFDSNYYVTSFAYEMMLHRVGNCAHFSALLTVLLSHLGFDTRMFHGEFINMDGSVAEHNWSYILVDGTYLWADIRIDHSVGLSTGAPSHTYFLVEDTEAWAREHTWDHAYSDWLKASEQVIWEELQQAAGFLATPWDQCSAWATDYMQAAGQAGLIPSRLDYQDLTRQITRAEFAAVAVKLYEALKQPVAPYEGPSPFTDTEDPDVLRAYALGVVNGMGEGLFAPDAFLTREQAVTMLGRVCELAMANGISGGAGLPQGDLRFTDDSRIADYSRFYVYFFAGAGILEGMGDGSFAPTASMTREAAIKVAVVTAQQFSM